MSADDAGRFKTGGSQAQDSKPTAHEEKARLGEALAGVPEQDNDDCTQHYHGEGHKFTERTTGEASPSGGWRAVYAAMEVWPR